MDCNKRRKTDVQHIPHLNTFLVQQMESYNVEQVSILVCLCDKYVE